MTNSIGGIAPVSTQERIHALDVMRGLALFGVLEANLIYFSGRVYERWAGIPFALGWGGSALVWVWAHLISAKAMYCFSMLFGVGLCIQMERARAKGHGFLGFASRRLLALGLIGLFHALLVWDGDILFDYAVLGVMLLPFLGARIRTILAAAGAFFLVNANLDLIVGWCLRLHVPKAFLSLDFYNRHSVPVASFLLESANRALGHGTWMDAFRWRVWEWNHMMRCLDETIPMCMPLFLIGLALWRSGLLGDGPGRVRTIRKLFHAIFWVGLILSILPLTWAKVLPITWEAGWRGFILRGVQAGAPLALAVGYFMGVMLLMQRARSTRLLMVVAPAGRMALTNYLVQSLVCTWTFNGYGLGLWGKVSPAEYMVGGVAFFCLQVAGSHWWLARFKFGPAEWLWRSMTYGAFQPFRMASRLPKGVRPAEQEA